MPSISDSRHKFVKHQRAAARYARERSAIALFMEMRLGKSPVAIRWAQAQRPSRVLLVAPLSTLLGSLNWQGELRREGIHATMVASMARAARMSLLCEVVWRRNKRRLVTRYRDGWFGINYEALRVHPDVLAQDWDVIICDESTRIRNPQAQITKLLIKHTGHINARAVLSGLPNPEHALDFFTQFQFLNGHFMGWDNYWKFRHRHFHTIHTDWDWAPKRGTLDTMKRYVRQQAFVLTRKQAGVGSAKVRQQRSVELNAKQRAALREMKRFEVGGVETKWVPVVETWMQRVAGGFHPVTLKLISDAKFKLVSQLLTEDFRKEPVVIWFHFNEEIFSLKKWLRKNRATKSLTVECVTGKTKKHERPKVQERFHRGKTQVLLMQVKLGLFGWNLAKSSTVIYYSNSYAFEERSQSEDRVIHLMKKEDCLYVDLVTLGTPDEDAVEAINEKRINARVFSRRMKEAVKTRAQFLMRGQRA